jgi:transposase
MEVQHARCCGIDIHKRSITACVLIRESGRREQKYIREFATTTSEILNCADWLRMLGVTHVAMLLWDGLFANMLTADCNHLGDL